MDSVLLANAFRAIPVALGVITFMLAFRVGSLYRQAYQRDRVTHKGLLPLYVWLMAGAYMGLVLAGIIDSAYGLGEPLEADTIIRPIALVVGVYALTLILKFEGRRVRAPGEDPHKTEVEMEELAASERFAAIIQERYDRWLVLGGVTAGVLALMIVVMFVFTLFNTARVVELSKASINTSRANTALLEALATGPEQQEKTLQTLFTEFRRIQREELDADRARDEKFLRRLINNLNKEGQ